MGYRLSASDDEESCNVIIAFRTGCTDSTSVGDTDLSIRWSIDVGLNDSGSIALSELPMRAYVVIDAGSAGVFRSDIVGSQFILNSESPDARIAENADIIVYPTDFNIEVL